MSDLVSSTIGGTGAFPPPALPVVMPLPYSCGMEMCLKAVLLDFRSQNLPET